MSSDVLLVQPVITRCIRAFVKRYGEFPSIADDIAETNVEDTKVEKACQREKIKSIDTSHFSNDSPDSSSVRGAETKKEATWRR